MYGGNRYEDEKAFQMSKQITLILSLFCIGACAPTQSHVERTIDNGVEVIVNREQPYIMKGEPKSLSLQEELIIDLEKESIASLGLTAVWGFDVNSEGYIYFFKSPLSQDDLVLKFDPQGNYVSSFARRGQGPGEVETPSFQKINDRDELPIMERGKSIIMLFNKNGNLVDESRLGVNIGSMGSMVYPIENGNYLIRRSLRGELEGTLDFVLSLFDPQLKEIIELDRFEIIQPIRAPKVRLPMQASVWCVSQDYIYVGNEKNGYEVRVFDYEGYLRRKIRKKYHPVKVSEEFKQTIKEKLEHTPPAVKDKIYFPDRFPAFQFIFADDKGHLFVMTFERGNNPKEYIIDIFNQGGVFIGTISLDVYLNDSFFAPGAPFDSWVTAKKDHLYALRIKPNGYKELVVYKTLWQ